jgi:uncharacterized protein YndB with AHSA1/START domain
MKNYIIVESVVNAPVEKVWDFWTAPQHIIQWNAASDDWHTTRAENDVRVGGAFSSRMEAKDGSFGFDFSGVYDEVELHKRISYVLGDERTVKITFESNGVTTKVSETFVAENENPIEMQRAGWQAILDNFKQYVEQSA